MAKASYYFEKLFFSLSFRIGIIVLVGIFLTIFVTSTSLKAHSESDVEYKQESVFTGAGLSAASQNNEPEINPDPEGIDDTVLPYSISYEVDKVTPTPVPVIEPSNNDIWIQLAQCESKQNWGIDTGNGYYGGLQFSLGAWASVGGSGKPSDASKEEQIERGKLLQAKRGWGVWGMCSKKLNLN